MNRLPRLVSEKIGWYQWKAKMDLLNSEYNINSYLYDDDQSLGIRKRKRASIFEYQRRKMEECIVTRDFCRNMIIYNYNDRFSDDMPVAIIPKYYFYSSGSCNQYGFLPSKVYKNINGCFSYLAS